MDNVRCAAPANVAVTSTKSFPPGRSICSKYIIRNRARVDQKVVGSDAKGQSVYNRTVQHATLPVCAQIQGVYA